MFILYSERQLELLSSINTTRDFEGWLELNVTSALISWAQKHEDNRGLYISVTPSHRPGNIFYKYSMFYFSYIIIK